jgi:predicted XRE-type DNA-binding protein
VNLEEIDQLLADWKQKLDVVGQNLIELHGLSAYQRLSSNSQVTLTGVTLARITPALLVMNELFQHFDLLTSTIDKAVGLRTLIPRFLASQVKIQEIEDLLTKPSIHLSINQIPLAQRGLLSVSQTTNAIAPQELLELMISAFGTAKEVVVTVDEVWSRLEPQIYSTITEISQLQKWAESLNINCIDEIDTLNQKLTHLRNSIEYDPLGVNEEFLQSIQPQIFKLKATIEQAAQLQKSLREAFTVAQQRLSNLLDTHRQAVSAFNESKIKVVDHSQLHPVAPEEIEAIAAWLSRLETKFNDGLFNPVRIGLENWTAKVKECSAKVQQAYVANQAPLNTRLELRGRLDALQAKALARGLAEDAILSELAHQAKKLLFARPTPLAQASELVSKYEKKLNSFPNSH